MKERLQKVMAQAGVASRRKCEEMITQGRVQVNGERVTSLGTKVEPNEDEIVVDGQLLKRQTLKYYLFYKPLRVVTTMHDPQGRRTVADYFRHLNVRIYPIGRLDYDTEGLLIMTNDGELAHLLMHPKHEIEKRYVVKVKGDLSSAQLRLLEDGIRLEDGMTAPAKAAVLARSPVSSTVEITIHEGRNRQVRRMFEAIGHPVLHLKRVGYGFLTLGGLKSGEMRPLTSNEVRQLAELASRASS